MIMDIDKKLGQMDAELKKAMESCFSHDFKFEYTIANPVKHHDNIYSYVAAKVDKLDESVGEIVYWSDGCISVVCDHKYYNMFNDVEKRLSRCD